MHYPILNFNLDMVDDPIILKTGTAELLFGDDRVVYRQYLINHWCLAVS